MTTTSTTPARLRHGRVEVVVCTECATTHGQPVCPTCAQRADAGDAGSCRLQVVGGLLLAVIAHRVELERQR